MKKVITLIICCLVFSLSANLMASTKTITLDFVNNGFAYGFPPKSDGELPHGTWIEYGGLYIKFDRVEGRGLFVIGRSAGGGLEMYPGTVKFTIGDKYVKNVRMYNRNGLFANIKGDMESDKFSFELTTGGNIVITKIEIDIDFGRPGDIITIDDVQYRFKDDGTIALHAYLNDYSTNFAIPEFISNEFTDGEKKITEIDNPGFYGKSELVSISMPGTIEKIGAYAFSNCSKLEGINIPDRVKELGNNCFAGCSAFSKVELPSALTLIPKELFKECKNLKEISMPRGITNISMDAFAGCSNITSISLSAQAPPTVDSPCFENSILKSAILYVPENSISKYKSAEYWKYFTNIKSLSSPKSITLNYPNVEISCGETVNLTYTLYPESMSGLKVGYSSENPKIADINQDGTIYGIAVGKTRIKVYVEKYPDIYAYCNVNVTEEITKPETTSITFAFADYGWDNSTAVETVPEKAGVSIKISKGTGSVAPAYYNSGAAIRMYGGNTFSIHSAQKIIKVEFDFVSDYNFESITHTGNSAVSLSAGTYSENGNKGEWTLNETDGTINIVGTKGSARITKATIYFTSGSASNVMVQSISLNAKNKTAYVGDKFTLTAQILPENATNKTVKWQSSNPQIANVDSNGNVSILKSGVAVISASTIDGSNLSASCTLSATSDVEAIIEDDCAKDVYSITGYVIIKNATREDLAGLSNGIYIIGGRKVLIHK